MAQMVKDGPPIGPVGIWGDWSESWRNRETFGYLIVPKGVVLTPSRNFCHSTFSIAEAASEQRKGSTVYRINTLGWVLDVANFDSACLR